MHRQKNREQGVTMVTLAVTIIVLIILAGVSIHTLIGDNGIITKARQARENIELAQVKEQTSLNQLYSEMENKVEIGGEEEVLEAFVEFKRKIAQAITEKGIQTSETDSSDTMANNIRNLNTTDATIYEIEDEEGNKIPVPKGFYYVGGSLSSGVIISDNVEDEYDGKTDKTTWEYTTNLKGNQFVWIPCTTSEYKKCNVWNGITQTNDTLANAWWDTTTPKSELTQIEKYGGFYVARYEAGLADTIPEFTTNQKHTGSNQIYNLNGIPQSKAGIIPWIFIDWNHAKENAESMYNNEYVSSGLITGTQWDVILNKMLSFHVISSSDLTNSNSWGNYMNNVISYTGRLARIDVNDYAWTLESFGITSTGTTSYNNRELLTTGASAMTEKYHICDMAGNVWEWTEEGTHYATNGQYRAIRGGSCVQNYEDCPACYRGGDYMDNHTDLCFGFRTVLYIK